MQEESTKKRLGIAVLVLMLLGLCVVATLSRSGQRQVNPAVQDQLPTAASQPGTGTSDQSSPVDQNANQPVAQPPTAVPTPTTNPRFFALPFVESKEFPLKRVGMRDEELCEALGLVKEGGNRPMYNYQITINNVVPFDLREGFIEFTSGGVCASTGTMWLNAREVYWIIAYPQNRPSLPEVSLFIQGGGVGLSTSSSEGDAHWRCTLGPPTGDVEQCNIWRTAEVEIGLREKEIYNVVVGSIRVPFCQEVGLSCEGQVTPSQVCIWGNGSKIVWYDFVIERWQ